MSYTSTTNLNLRKDNGDEKIVDIRPHLNTNLDTIDQAYGELDSRCRGQQTWGNLKSTSTWGELKGNGVTTPSSQTTNLELIKPGYDSNVDVEVFNDNMDIIDSSIKSLRDSVTPKLNNVYASGVGYVTGTDIISVWLPLRNCDKYTTFNLNPLNARGVNGMVFNDSSLPTNIVIVQRSSIGCLLNITQRSPDASNRYKVCTVEFYITAS